MKRRNIFQIFIFLFPISIFSQGMQNNGADIKIKAGSWINIKNSGFSNESINSTIYNSGTIKLEGVLDNYGTINGDLIIGGSGTKNARIGNVESLEITNSGTISVLDDCSISRVLKLSGGDFNTNSQIVVLKSDANGTALVDHNGGTTTGDFEVQRYISNGNGHHFVSSPVTSATINELGDDFNLNLSNPVPYIYYYDETSTAPTAAQRWASPTTSSHPMSPGEGFTCWFNASSGKTIEINGELNDGPVNIPMTFTNSSPVSSNTNAPGSPEGWNFIGNPYASPIDYDLLIASAPSAIAHGLYRWDPNTSTYISYINGIANPSTFNALIPSMQGFWLRTSANCTLTMDNSIRVTDPDAVSSIFLKSSNNDPIARIELTGQGKSIESVLTFNDNATNDFDHQYDAYFLPSDEPDEIKIASQSDKGILSINSLASLTNSATTIPLYNKVSTTGSYTISLREFNNFPGNSQLILEDKALSFNQVLNNGDYTYNGSPNDAEDRFVLTVIPDYNNIVNIEEEAFKIYKSDKTLVINLPYEINKKQTLIIHDISGRTIFSKTLKTGQKEYRINGLDFPGNTIYIASISGEDKGVKFKW